MLWVLEILLSILLFLNNHIGKSFLRPHAVKLLYNLQMTVLLVNMIKFFCKDIVYKSNIFFVRDHVYFKEVNKGGTEARQGTKENIKIAYFVIVTNLQNHLDFIWIPFTFLVPLKFGPVIKQGLCHTWLLWVCRWRWSNINFNWHIFPLKTVTQQ